MTIFRFPESIGREGQVERFPFVAITPVKYRHNTYVRDEDRAALGALATSVGYKGGLTGNQERVVGADRFYLPLPASVGNSYSPNWEMTDTTWLSWMLSSAGNLANSGGTNMTETVKNVGAGLLDSGVNAVEIALGGKFSQLFGAKIRNPKKQALFNGIDPRSFTFDYLFSPQSLHEAELIERMIRSLTQFTLPKDSEDNLFYEFPYEFELEFHNVAGYPKISPCVCTGISTNYNPTVVQLLQSGHPVQIGLSMSFLETSLRTRDNPGL